MVILFVTVTGYRTMTIEGYGADFVGTAYITHIRYLTDYHNLLLTYYYVRTHSLHGSVLLSQGSIGGISVISELVYRLGSPLRYVSLYS